MVITVYITYLVPPLFWEYKNFFAEKRRWKHIGRQVDKKNYISTYILTFLLFLQESNIFFSGCHSSGLIFSHYFRGYKNMCMVHLNTIIICWLTSEWWMEAYRTGDVCVFATLLREDEEESNIIIFCKRSQCCVYSFHQINGIRRSLFLCPFILLSASRLSWGDCWSKLVNMIITLEKKLLLCALLFNHYYIVRVLLTFFRDSQSFIHSAYRNIYVTLSLFLSSSFLPHSNVKQHENQWLRSEQSETVNRVLCMCVIRKKFHNTKYILVSALYIKRLWKNVYTPFT